MEFFLTYVLGGKSEVSFFRSEHVCKRLRETVDTSDDSKRPHPDLKMRAEKRTMSLG